MESYGSQKSWKWFGFRGESILCQSNFRSNGHKLYLLVMHRRWFQMSVVFEWRPCKQLTHGLSFIERTLQFLPESTVLVIGQRWPFHFLVIKCRWPCCFPTADWEFWRLTETCICLSCCHRGLFSCVAMPAETDELLVPQLWKRKLKIYFVWFSSRRHTRVHLHIYTHTHRPRHWLTTTVTLEAYVNMHNF